MEVSAPNPRGRAARHRAPRRPHASSAPAPTASTCCSHFGELVLHSHLGMSGSWHTYRRGEPWRKPVGAAWAVLSTERAEAVQFGGPTLRLLRAEALRRDPVLARLGPDILAADFDAEPIARSLAGAPDRSLGDALLDQHLVAGIGNIFKSEACFAAHLDPWQRVGDLPDEQLRHVAPGRPRPDARSGRGRPPGPRRLQARRPPLPRLRHPDPLPRPGRRQPHHLLVPELPAGSPAARRLGPPDPDRGTTPAMPFWIAVGAPSRPRQSGAAQSPGRSSGVVAVWLVEKGRDAGQTSNLTKKEQQRTRSAWSAEVERRRPGDACLSASRTGW